MFVQVLIYIFKLHLALFYFGGAIIAPLIIKGATVVRLPVLPGFELLGLKNVMERSRGIIKFSLS